MLKTNNFLRTAYLKVAAPCASLLNILNLFLTFYLPLKTVPISFLSASRILNLIFTFSGRRARSHWDFFSQYMSEIAD